MIVVGAFEVPGNNVIEVSGCMSFCSAWCISWGLLVELERPRSVRCKGHNGAFQGGRDTPCGGLSLGISDGIPGAGWCLPRGLMRLSMEGAVRPAAAAGDAAS